VTKGQDEYKGCTDQLHGKKGGKNDREEKGNGENIL
jgi:hypothetical protein